MKNTKTVNTQSFNNSQKNVNFNAWRDIIHWNVNKTEIVDNSWYSIPKVETNLYEKVWKFIISKLWEKWWLFSSISLILGWCLISLLSLPKYLQNLHYTPITNTWWDMKSIFTNMFSTINFYWFLWMFWFLLCILWMIIYRSIEHKNNSQCPKCKKPYSLTEVWKSKEKEIKTSKWYRVTQIRNYKCKNCKFEKQDESTFIRLVN